MNLNIVTTENDFLTGYENYIISVDKISFNDFELQPGQPNNVIINYAHEYVPYNEQDFENFIKLIRLNGTVTIIGQDFWTIVKQFSELQLDSKQINKLLSNKKSVWTLYQILTIITRNNFKITKKRIENHEYTISATKISD